jgi:ATP-binding cassette subfamily B protein/subfamily B ATP-binding cassette protein MsbA
LTIGDVTMFLVYLTMLLGPLETLANSATTFQNNLAGLDRVLDLLAEPLETEHTPPTARLDPRTVAGQITFQDVSFHYPGSAPLVLAGINLEVLPGETVALVGRSGAGKTTLCNLVARFYDPTTGSIRLDGQDLRSCRSKRIAVAGNRRTGCFSVRRHDRREHWLCPPQRNAGADRVRRVANAHEFISHMKDGYDTLIGERGVRLSGGQRQRLAIARALLADPRILILDEATSNLDSESEQQIHLGLERLMQGRTSFVIAHRLSTIARADKIVVLDQGRIVETGTHHELLAQSGRYRHMVELQMGPVTAAAF